MPPQKSDRPQLWIVAGANGSGKSTLYKNFLIKASGRPVWIINPDLLSAHIAAEEQMDLPDANLAAVRRIQSWLEASLPAYQTVGVETVLSTDKYRPLVLEARKRGFEIWLLYVAVRTAAINIERVRLRVAKGGHYVPTDKVRSRRIKSFEQLPWFLEHADRAIIYDNSGDRPIITGRKADGAVLIEKDAPMYIRRALR